MHITPIPAFQDNYCYLVTDGEIAIAIDPVDPDGVISAAEEEGVKIVAVFCSHHHVDHAGGNEALNAKIKASTGHKVPVYGGSVRVAGVTDVVAEEGTVFHIGHLDVQIIATPCHTQDSICFLVAGKERDAPRALFTGDTLFIGGCGRFFEGSAEQMLNAMDKFAALPGNTLVYCGHEYTLSNFKFARTVETDSEDVKAAFEMANCRESSIPSTIDAELACNPFMRCRIPDVQAIVGCKGDPEATMARIRAMKDKF